ncbi:phosphoenolpyruvate--protein phosphotransferase [Phenylobacterium sp.]|uniref:phosphoenolpyruvate--protein phosphotransferase n=1 Tax=Phenylobacterium sp. TaxID=1871053 RepID=UPI002DE80E55|nr:phosphoenolpyruvate--protein phosphotransferase [Phenylobacterium sp.]
MTAITLLSPLAGWAAPLEETPDPVFAQRMMGEGLAIDPTGEALFAPCAGTIVKVHEARHAVILRAGNGAEILMHLGLETVGLGGEGFVVHVTDGQSVAAGDRLIGFDLDQLARRAPSLLSPVLVTNSEAFAVRVLRTGCEVAVGDPILQVVAVEAVQAAGPRATAARTASRSLLVTHPHGLHARPAARIAAEAKRAAGEVEIARGEARADARSPVAIMTLGVAPGEEITVTASGEDAEAVVAAIAVVVEAINAAPAPDPPPPIHTPAPRNAPAGAIRGIRAAPGLAIGPAWKRTVAEAPVSERSAGRSQEAAALDDALGSVASRLSARRRQLAGDAAEIIEAHLALLGDPQLLEPARTAIAAGASAGVGWREAIGGRVAALRASPDPRVAERAHDLKDLEQQVLWALSGLQPQAAAPPAGAILLADDLLPSDLVGLDGAGLGGICTARGGPTSHVAVLAAAMDIPALVAAGPEVLAVADGLTLILDADAGLLDTACDAKRLHAARVELAARAQRGAEALAAASEPGRTADGGRIEVFANVGAVADAVLAARSGAEGCGLLRTEFLFLHRDTPPSEDEQVRQYQAVAEALAGPIVIRTLDVGGDKPAPYLALPAEENPALGVRGVRVSLRQPDLLSAQLRAILRVEPAGRCRIMAPMVSSLSELRAMRKILAAACADLGREAPPLGVMIETPAAAVTADLIAVEADFLSIGTNDLAQYTLAMDRGNPGLAAEVDALHPAVLRLIRMAAAGAAAHDRPVSVCGGLASDPVAVPILIGLGVGELSVAPARIPAIKALIRTLDLPACRALAARACDRASAAEVRALQLKPRARRRAAKGAPA